MAVFVYDLRPADSTRGWCGQLSPAGRYCDRIAGHTGRHHVGGRPVSDAPGERRFWVAEVWS